MFSRKTPAQKSVLYFALCDALREDGCPICSLLVKYSMAALDSLLYEQVTDPAARARLQASHGFCNWHAWMLLRIPSGRSGVAIIYATLLRQQLDALHTLQQVLAPRSFWQRVRGWLSAAAPLPFLKQWMSKSPCPVCVHQQRSDERAYLRALLDALAEPAFVEQFPPAFGLCLPHVALALTSERDHPTLPLFVRLQTQKMETLQARLRDIIRTFDYRFATELPADAGPEWQRAIELFVGKPAVFGNERFPDTTV